MSKMFGMSFGYIKNRIVDADITMSLYNDQLMCFMQKWWDCPVLH